MYNSLEEAKQNSWNFDYIKTLGYHVLFDPEGFLIYKDYTNSADEKYLLKIINSREPVLPIR